MDLKAMFTVFGVVFLAELGDKTQLATLLFASDKAVNKFTVMLGASLALISTTAIAVLAGDWVSQHISEKTLRYLAGGGFVTIGLWTLIKN